MGARNCRVFLEGVGTEGRHSQILVSEDDRHLLNAHSWRIEQDKRTRYVVATSRAGGKRRTVRLHRLITGALAGDIVDHVNGNGLDNRRENLRICTPAENARNRRRWERAPTEFKGITRRRGKWRAQICVDGRVRTIGEFKTAEEAARAYDAAARTHFGEFARTNFQSGGSR